ncbi:MAG: di-trans,poly-cis-decaprenylcistransferase [Rhodothermales bacterium]
MQLKERPMIHVAIIMDGNGRWAEERGRPRHEGHRVGVEAVRRAVRAAPRCGIGTLTLYAFSSDNWRRPETEVQALMQLFGEMLRLEAPRCRADGVRLSLIGRRDRLAPSLRRAAEEAEQLTASGTTLHLRLAVDYSARDAIVQAAGRLSPGADRAAFAGALAHACHADEAVPDVDLLIRTGGDQRLSDFLLWECAYAELVFTPRLWPDFDASDLETAIRAFAARERRFGGLPSPMVSAAPRRCATCSPSSPSTYSQPLCNP